MGGIWIEGIPAWLFYPELGKKKPARGYNLSHTNFRYISAGAGDASQVAIGLFV
jgi:hypothetical protein